MPRPRGQDRPPPHPDGRPRPPRGASLPKQDSRQITAHTSGTKVHRCGIRSTPDTRGCRPLRRLNMPAARRCATCRQPLDPASHPTRRYCSPACRYRASKRRQQGIPISDRPTSSTAHAIDLDAALAQRERQLSGKERTIARLRAGRDADRRRMRELEAEAASERRRAERAIASVGKDQHRLRAEKASLQDQIIQAHEAVRGRDAEVERLRQTVREISPELTAAREVRRQWEALAVRIARQAAGSNVPLAGLDQEVLTTYQRQRQAPAGDPQPATAKTPPRKNRPAARPAARPGTSGRTTR